MNPTIPLRDEHRVILRMFSHLERKLLLFRDDGRVDAGYVDLATEFIRTYADQCHHGKEEGILFRGLATKDLGRGLASLMDELVQEHAWARKTTERLIEANRAYAAGDESQLDRLLKLLKQLVHFYPGHITKEESRFFGPSLGCLGESEQEAMLREYAAFDQAIIHERYRELAEQLED
jgi:hemerythrin-like domain-containing protein